MIRLETVQKMARELPGIYEESSYGTPGFKIDGKLLVRIHQKEDAFVVRVASEEQQQDLIAEDPSVFYITDHYKGHPYLLVRPTIEDDRFFRLLHEAWWLFSPKSIGTRFR